MTVPVLLISDDKVLAEQIISKFSSQALNIAFGEDKSKVSGVIIISTGKDLPYLRQEYLSLLDEERKFPIALYIMNTDKMLKDNSYEFVDVDDFVLSEAGQISSIGFAESEECEMAKICKESEIVEFIEQNSSNIIEMKPISFSEGEIVVEKKFEKHGKWGWLPRE